MSRKGEVWNESELVEDPLTLKKKRRITSSGQYNLTPSYHTGDAFTASADCLIFATARQGRSALCKADTESGDITCLIDPVDGIGSEEQMHNKEIERGYVGNGRGIDIHTEVLPASRLAVYSAEREIRSVHLDTLEEQSLVEVPDGSVYTGSSATPDEQFIYYSFLHGHPQIVNGAWATLSLVDAYREAGFTPSFEIFRVPVSGGEAEIVYSEKEMMSGHIQCCPVDPDLLLINRDGGIARATEENRLSTRTWLLRVSTGQLTELAPADENKFQIHVTWSWDGSSVIYHGPSAGGGWYIGIAATDGRIIREYRFPQAAFYGHVSAMVDRPAIIIDGNVTEDTLFWLYYDQEQPRLEAIARHASNWTGMPWQYPHPHAHCSPDGRFISYNAATSDWTGRGRNDVWLIEL